MARPLISGLSSATSRLSSAEPVIPEAGIVDRSAARALAAAISSLIISTLVVSQSAQALDPEGTIGANAVAAGTVNLVDDDQGRSLVNLTDMAPGRPVEECIVVTYEGTVLPVDISLAATTIGPLADYLWVDAELGSGGGYGSCDGFVASEVAFSGSVTDFAQTDPLRVAKLRNQGDGLAFRFRFDVLDDAGAIGQAASVDFVWEATPS